MGEAKRRKKSMGGDYGKEQRLYPWLPLTKTQAEQAYTLTTKGAWIGIGLMVAVWVTVRIIGPGLGWWIVD
ncbi:hypothetical protein NIES970_10410 [[Synechococcus] sp. NIES-970]|uniref:DUF2839 domain-containing protein n=1 Tax=Picosynechococcus sp. NKBG15041c TaxID=1407650 RepID=UPI00040865EE|nr:DUF2839 domain-containing protein [Picosynechococcus sp. NKBG15041c]BAW96118.1 hypothetical protein NIES970_10410 [[Synechococcus] sp. NIES-970]